ncbi:MAG: FAD-dependent oxidoreductase, partial [Methylacidiphilales bacterium]|nr:FAD-dependent oxidoreductase [Candidatus Methylacidiphilales bacterium]
DYDMVDRLTRIYYKKRFFYYPLKPLDALIKLGCIEAVRCLMSYIKVRLFPLQDTSTFENWVTNRFGRRLFEIFFKTYSEKLWGISCQELDADFAAQRIKKLSLYEAIKNALLGGKGNQHKTLVDQFAYPHGGTGVIYERMAQAIRNRGGAIFLNTPVYSVQTENKPDALYATGITLEDGSTRSYDHIISTMPLSLMVARLTHVPQEIKTAAEQLKYRNTIIVYLRVESEKLFPDNWLYIHSPDLGVGRITNFRNWSPTLLNNTHHTILALEYWCYDQDPIWTSPDENLIQTAKQELARTGLNRQAPVTAGYVYRIKRCYPVYERGYRKKLKPIEDYLSSIRNLHVIGRYGAFKYNNQDHSILMGILAAENIHLGTKHNLWEVNTDYEYQESSVITATGLQKK